MPKFWVKVGKKVGGPFTSEKLQQLATKGKLKPTHLVSRDKKRWATADKVRGLSFPLEPALPSMEDVSKSDEESDGPPLTKPSAPASRSKNVSPPISVKYHPVEGEEAPTVTEKKRSYLQVLTKDGKVKKCRLRVVRRQLLRGKLTRHNPSRWIEPRPKKSDYIDEANKKQLQSEKLFSQENAPDGELWAKVVDRQYDSDPDDEILKEMYLDDVKKWKTRRKWRPIGEGLAKESYRIRLLYSPAKVFMELGTYITGGFLFVVVLIMFAVMMFQQLMESEVLESEGFKQVADGMDPGNGFDYMLNQLRLRFALPILIPIILTVGGAILSVAVLIAALGGFLFGGLGGWLLGTCVGPLLPTPPPDGYVEQAEPKT